MSLDVGDWLKLGTTALGLSKGSRANNRAQGYLQNVPQLPTSGSISASTPRGGISGFYGDGDYSLDLSGFDVDSPYFADLDRVMEEYYNLIPMARDIYNRGAGFNADRSRFLGLFNGLGDLRGTVAPGFSQLRDARLNQIEDARQKATGNLRDSLARRRVAGSSFASDDMARMEAEFGRAKSQAEAQSFLEELDANMRIISQQQQVGQSAMQALQSRLQTELGAVGVMGNALNGVTSAASAGLQADLSADLQILSASLGGLQNLQSYATNMQQLMQQNAIAMAELASGEAAGYGQLAGLGLSGIFDMFGDDDDDAPMAGLNASAGLSAPKFNIFKTPSTTANPFPWGNYA